jgi:hypothetical protein
MRVLFFIPLGVFLAASVAMSAAVQAEAGISHFLIRDGRLEQAPDPLSVDQPSEFAPFVAATVDLTSHIGLRFSYHYVNDVRTTAAFGSPPLPGGNDGARRGLRPDGL